MPLPANIFYLCWRECVPFEECQSIVQGFADDNFTQIVDSSIWYEEKYGDTITCMCIMFNRYIYKIKCDTLAYNGRINDIMEERYKETATLDVQRWKNSMFKCSPFRIKDEYLTTYHNLHTFWKELYQQSGRIFWVVDPDQYITNILTTNIPNRYEIEYPDYMMMYKWWNVYNDPYQLRKKNGGYTLYPTEQLDADAYNHLNNFIEDGTKMLVVTPWIPCLPASLDHRKWCFAKVKEGSNGEADWSPFIPERPSKAKSARK